MFDLIVSQKIQSLDPRLYLRLMEFFTNLGDIKILVLMVVVFSAIFWYLNKHLEAKLLILTVIFSAALGTTLKVLINRPRPSSELVHIFVVETSRSFPSNHALISLVFFGLLALFINNRIVSAVFSLIILLIGLSRIYLGVHWASDVLGGYLIGAVIIYFSNLIYKQTKNHEPRTRNS